jgi:tetraacyldisaccharide 4'-kinase
MMKAPKFWYQPPGLTSWALAPLAAMWRLVTNMKRARAHPYIAPVPVISIGNLTVGGTGKTPIVQVVAEYLSARGVKVHILSRGYGGRLKGPVQVDIKRHSSDDVGDEPLLLAESAPVWIARDRAQAAQAAVKAGAQLLVLDDGHQNLTLAIDCALAVVDAATGFGNGHIVPAGPLRESIADGLARAQGIILMGEGEAVDKNAFGSLPLARAHLQPVGVESMAGMRAFAFAGIGRPQKFFDTVKQAGLNLVGTREFADHHAYHGGEIMKLLVQAEQADAILITTQKDWVRLEPPFRLQVSVLMVKAMFDDAMSLEHLLAPVLTRAGL